MENKNTKESLFQNKLFVDILSSILAIFFGVLMGFIIMLIINPSDSLNGLSTILIGGYIDFGNMAKTMTRIGNVLSVAGPYILVGLSISFAFKTGLFNIGAPGQLTVGAVAAIYVGVHFGFLGSFQWVIAVLFGIVFGGLWGLIPGMLKAYRNVNEVVSGIMLNYIAMYMCIAFITFTMYSVGARTTPIKESAQLPTWLLIDIFPDSNVDIGILIAIFFTIIIHFILYRTTFGYELKAVGLSKDTAVYAGVNEKKSIIYSLTISGALSGLAGACIYLKPGTYFSVTAEILPQGFIGIAISLLGLSTPFGSMFAGLFYAGMERGGFYIQILDYNPEIIDIIISVIIYFSALTLFVKKYVGEFTKKRKSDKLISSLEDSKEGEK